MASLDTPRSRRPSRRHPTNHRHPYRHSERQFLTPTLPYRLDHLHHYQRFYLLDLKYLDSIVLHQIHQSIYFQPKIPESFQSYNKLLGHFHRG